MGSGVERRTGSRLGKWEVCTDVGWVAGRDEVSVMNIRAEVRQRHGGAGGDRGRGGVKAEGAEKGNAVLEYISSEAPHTTSIGWEKG